MSGSFRTHPVACLNVRIKGHGLERVWTQRALERLGFGIAEADMQTAFAVEVRASTWLVDYFGQTHRFDSIEQLIDWVRNQDWRIE
jgi:hypothetical protein